VLERGILSEEDFSSILEKHGDSPQEIFNLIEAIEFEDHADVKAVSKGDLDFLEIFLSKWVKINIFLASICGVIVWEKSMLVHVGNMKTLSLWVLPQD